jgi:hypothetical protein
VRTERQWRRLVSGAMEAAPLEVDRFTLPDGCTVLVGRDTGDLASPQVVIVEDRGSREANARVAMALRLRPNP